MECKYYRIAGHNIKVALEGPWTFKGLSPEQEALVAWLRAGEDAGVESVPADRQEQLALNDAIMGKERMTREIWETLGASERESFRHSLDFLQYAPFEVSEADDLLFSFTVHASPMALF